MANILRKIQLTVNKQSDGERAQFSRTAYYARLADWERRQKPLHRSRYLEFFGPHLSP